MKRCTKCGIEKPLTEFYNHTAHGRVIPHAECKVCTLKVHKANRKVITQFNTDEVIVLIENSNATKTCVSCLQSKPITEFSIRRSEKDGHSSYCKSCCSVAKKKVYLSHNQLSSDDYKQWRCELNIKNKAEKLRLKTDVFSHYGNGIVKCVNPFHLHEEDITDLDILSLDHINGDGYKNRDKYGRRFGGIVFYRKLKLQGYLNGFQVLCGNCQMKKKIINNEHGDRFNKTIL